jgi:hypothetical protein
VADNIQTQIATKCAEFQELSGVSISSAAIDLGAQIIGAISEDPHSSWKLDANQRTTLVSLAISAVPLMLSDISKSEAIVKGKEITTFDVVHWLSKRPLIIEAFPIPKS